MEPTPGACIIKLFTAVINALMYKAMVFVFIKAIKKLMTITKTLAQYITDFLMAVKSFMIQAQGVKVTKCIFFISRHNTITNILRLSIYTSMKPSLLKPRAIALFLII